MDSNDAKVLAAQDHLRKARTLLREVRESAKHYDADTQECLGHAYSEASCAASWVAGIVENREIEVDYEALMGASHGLEFGEL